MSVQAPFAHVGEYAFNFRIDAGRAVSDVSSASIALVDPDKNISEHTATDKGNGTTETALRFWGFTVGSASVLDEVGNWIAQLKLTLTSGRTIGYEVSFYVGKRWGT